SSTSGTAISILACAQKVGGSLVTLDTAPPPRSPSGQTSQKKAVGPWSRAWTRFRQNRIALISLGLVVVLALVAIFAPVLAPYGHAETNYDQTLAPLGTPGHVLGTDVLGRDMLSRMIFGFRTALLVAVVAEALSVQIGRATCWEIS